MTNPDPGWSHKGLHMFDVGEEAQADSDEIISRVAIPMGNLIQATAGYCTRDDCQVASLEASQALRSWTSVAIAVGVTDEEQVVRKITSISLDLPKA